MMPMPPRPTWFLKEEEHPCTFPAEQIDPDLAIQAALETRVGCDRMNDVTNLEKAAVAHAMECMSDALAEVALRSLGRVPGGLVGTPSGWSVGEATAFGPSEIDLSLVNREGRGAWHLRVSFQSKMTPEACARKREVEARMEAAGVDLISRVLAEVAGTPAPYAEELRGINADPANWEQISRGRQLTKVIATAIDLGPQGGRPEGVEETIFRKEFAKLAPGSTWWPGRHLEAGPVMSLDRDTPQYAPNVQTEGACPHLPMMILSELVRANDLMARVAQRARIAGERPWLHFGDEHTAPIDDAGHALVHAAGGIFDPSVLSGIERFSAGIAAQGVERHLEAWRQTAQEMIREGITSEDREFDCNDLRDLCHAGQEEKRLWLQVRTQNGTYRLEMGFSEDGAVSEVLAMRVHGGKGRPVGRFRMTDAGLRAAYGTDIPYHIRNIRDMNGIMNSLASVACVWRDERPESSPSP
jgi:hypothetical protein